MEILNNIWIYISPVIASFLTYFIAIKGKQKDVDIEKERKLNTVISNLLDVWNYLGNLKNLADLNKVDLPIPFKILPRILLNSKSLNDNSFKDLENSISLLKEYDPIIYYELSGLGLRFDEIKTNFILPFINAKKQSDLNKRISETYIQETIQEIEENLVSISNHLGFRTSKRIKKKIRRNQGNNIEETKKELLQNYYDFMMTIVPENLPKPTLEEFEKELNCSETQSILEEQMELFTNVDLSQIMSVVAENPYASLEEVRNSIE
ncbi:MAG: hypothetical protein ABJI22_02045 [Maribacter sp.]